MSDKTSGDRMPHRNADESVDLGVLRERLQSNEANINRVADETARQIRELASSTGSQIRDLAQSTQSQTNSLANQIGKLDNSLQERGKIQWPAFSLLLAGVTVIATLAYWPINSAQTRIEQAVSRLAENTPSNKEINIAALRRDDWQRAVEERFKRADADADAMQKAIVPRGEHEEKWRGADIRFADHQRQIDTLRTQFESLYSPRDAITSMLRRLEDVERRLIAASAPRS